MSNSSGLARWVRSPVCSRKAGRSGRALIRSIASCNVAVTSLFGSLLKPMWLSLIWTNVKSPAGGPEGVLPDRTAPQDAAADGPGEPGAGPGHALEEPAAVDAVVERGRE